MGIQFKTANINGKMLRVIDTDSDIFGSDIDFGDKLQFIDYRDELLEKMDALDKTKQENDELSMLTPKISPMMNPMIDSINEMSEVILDEIDYKNKQVNDWNVNDVYLWLISVDLMDIAAQFKKAKIRGLILKEMSIQQLNEENVFDIEYGDKLLFIRLRNELLTKQLKSDEAIVSVEIGMNESANNEKLNDLRSWIVNEL